jgi:small-conductance mechanosensitive channel
MIAYSHAKRTRVHESKQIALSNVPFQPRQREVVLIAEEERLAARVQELRTLLKATQTLPQARAITDEEITAQVAAYRAGDASCD